ncbi:aminotransferase class I/II-fold pyridoxal phosphate-dependent enzyme [Bacillus carboniphilus]|uniref:Aminotransferase class I/II-fold pyridoxal phosphate-dependent enzyme n=1 Tax=Bacillus carboniphilus TaxID=86663 RepID=A0ABY9JSW7_9BACI|nr:aminotransferase class I/II-fold pyridoxal phosphate-dependent enzyme [Bacillus carboniphilus]WLR41909.1 aminotransferase class I/II-fold pyridoxal phosphate-dependent enzyme [Bacillus carboniphilus]
MEKTPIFTALQKHIAKSPLSFHVPGHKNGQVFHPTAMKYFKEILKLDVTELTGLDDLHHASGMIAEAEQLTADLYGVQSTSFLVNGSTVGNLAMIMAVCEEQDVVIVQRNCHKSIIHGLELVGAKPLFISPEWDEELLVGSYLSVEKVKQTINKYPDVKAIIVTHPNYYGLASKHIEHLVEFAHDKGIPVLVDEAHGAHFILGDPFPISAVKANADIVVQSAHKTLPAMTMGSYLHMQGNIVDHEKVKYYLSVLQTSSPSYVIMASLDLARAYLKSLTEEKTFLIPNLIRMREDINKLQGLSIIESKDPNVIQDPLKVNIRSTQGYSGIQLQKSLEESGIFPELADINQVLLILSLTNEQKQPKIHSLKEISEIQEGNKPLLYSPASPIQEMPYTYKELTKLKKRRISLKEAVGNVSAETITPYPPGIPLIMKGEEIQGYHIEKLRQLLENHYHIQGGSFIKQQELFIYQGGRQHEKR